MNKSLMEILTLYTYSYEFTEIVICDFRKLDDDGNNSDEKNGNIEKIIDEPFVNNSFVVS